MDLHKIGTKTVLFQLGFRSMVRRLAGLQQAGYSILYSGKVCIKENVNADQQDCIGTAESGPEHTLSNTENSGSWSFL